MKIKEIISQIEKIAPKKLAQSWDNTGLLVGDGNSRPGTMTKKLMTLYTKHFNKEVQNDKG
jgi:putative NIF3 family GTP cyclohydrolase 1 type 2